MSERRKPVYREDSMAAEIVRPPPRVTHVTPSDKYVQDRKRIADAARVVMAEDAELLARLAK